MKVCADCGPCLMKRILFQARLAGTGKEFDVVKQCMGMYSDLMDKCSCSAEIATKVHALSYEIMGNSDPYRSMKIDADRIAQEYLPLAEEFIEKSSDKFVAAVRVSLIGNIMDFGSGIAIDSPSEFGKLFNDLLRQGIGSDETDELKRLIDSTDSVMYAFDNCGECVFDMPLIRMLRSMGKRVVGVVRGAAILNDVTHEDAVRVGLDREMDRIVSNGAFSIGFPPKVEDPGFLEEIMHAGVMITKGMANYESLSEYTLPIPVVFMLRAKCLPVANSLNVPVGTNVVRIKRM